LLLVILQAWLGRRAFRAMGMMFFIQDDCHFGHGRMMVLAG
jgi:hypothetical protein